MVDQVSAGTTTPPAAIAAPTGVTTSGATGYNVYRNANKVNALLVSDTVLAAAPTYSWTVKSIDANSAESVASSAASGTTTGTPPPVATC